MATRSLRAKSAYCGLIIHLYYRAPRLICPLIYRLSASLVDRGEFIKICLGMQTFLASKIVSSRQNCLASKNSSSHTICTRSTCTGTPLSTHFILHRGVVFWPRVVELPPPKANPACRNPDVSANRHVRELTSYRYR
jgi:hypothetical protein